MDEPPAASLQAAAREGASRALHSLSRDLPHVHGTQSYILARAGWVLTGAQGLDEVTEQTIERERHRPGPHGWPCGIPDAYLTSSHQAAAQPLPLTPAMLQAGAEADLLHTPWHETPTEPGRVGCRCGCRCGWRYAPEPGRPLDEQAWREAHARHRVTAIWETITTTGDTP